MNIFKNGVGRPSNNIKRARMIIGAIALILSATIGYALFSQEIKVTGTATASGTFKVTPTCRIATNKDLNSMWDTSPIGRFYSNESCTISENKVTASVTLNQPSAALYFLVTLQNAGTINANLKSIVPTSTTTGAKTSSTGNVYSVTSSDDIIFMNLLDANIVRNRVNSNISPTPITSLASGTSHDYFLIAAWDDEDKVGTNQTLNGTWTFNWEQATN